RDDEPLDSADSGSREAIPDKEGLAYDRGERRKIRSPHRGPEVEDGRGRIHRLGWIEEDACQESVRVVCDARDACVGGDVRPEDKEPASVSPVAIPCADRHGHTTGDARDRHLLTRAGGKCELRREGAGTVSTRFGRNGMAGSEDIRIANDREARRGCRGSLVRCRGVSPGAGQHERERSEGGEERDEQRMTFSSESL